MKIGNIIDRLVEGTEGYHCFWILPTSKEIIEVPKYEHALYVVKNPEKFNLKVVGQDILREAILQGAVEVQLVENDYLALRGLLPSIRNKLEQIKELITKYKVKTIIGGPTGEITSANRFLKLMSESIAVDLDGTLAQHEVGGDIDTIGDPIEKMVSRVQNWLEQGKTVKIFTARAGKEEQVELVKKWLEDNGLPELDVTNIKLPEFEEFYDDKAVAVIPNTGELVMDFLDKDVEEAEIKKSHWSSKIHKIPKDSCPGCGTEPHNVRKLASGEKTCKRCGLIWESDDVQIKQLFKENFGDVELVTELYYNLLKEFTKKHEIVNDDVATFCLVKQDEIIGAITIDFRMLDGVTEPWITYLAIEKKYQHQGYGKLLLEKAEGYTKGLGYKELYVGSYWDFGALGFYRKAGFKTYDVNRIDKYTDFKKGVGEAINKLIQGIPQNTGARPMLKKWQKSLSSTIPVSKEVQENVTLSQPLSAQTNLLQRTCCDSALIITKGRIKG